MSQQIILIFSIFIFGFIVGFILGKITSKCEKCPECKECEKCPECKECEKCPECKECEKCPECKECKECPSINIKNKSITCDPNNNNTCSINWTVLNVEDPEINVDCSFPTNLEEDEILQAYRNYKNSNPTFIDKYNTRELNSGRMNL